MPIVSEIRAPCILDKRLFPKNLTTWASLLKFGVNKSGALSLAVFPASIVFDKFIEGDLGELSL